MLGTDSLRARHYLTTAFLTTEPQRCGEVTASLRADIDLVAGKVCIQAAYIERLTRGDLARPGQSS